MPRVVDVEARRAELADAAARVIARDGIAAATMRDVAAEAGLTTGALVHYFTDKRQLLLFTFQSSLDRRRSQRPERAGATLLDALRRSLEGALPLDEARRRHWMVTIAFCAQAAGDADLAAAQVEAYREFRTHVAALVSSAGIAERAEALAVAERLIAAADGIAVQALFDPQSWPASRQRRRLDELVEPLLAPGGTPPPRGVVD
jgi:AcrR family transcriptional regulator